MRNHYYVKLAWDNIRKNAKIYIPYIITSILTAAMLYIIRSLATNPDYEKLPRGSHSLPIIMNFGSYVTMIFAFIFLFYTNSFIVKRRRKEFGLLNILGMEKRHIAKMLFIETVYIVLITLLCGFGIGILLDKLMFLSLTRLIGESVVLGFHISVDTLIVTTVFILGTFFLVYLNMLRQIHLAKPIELLSGSNTGEKEPKTKVIMTLLGLVLIGVGYYLSMTVNAYYETDSFLKKVFIAVVCVMVGTYFLFMAVSITILKLLKRDQKYYYKTNHFTAVSGLLYRMKRNAVGLASVCILSTMVLVMISSTTSLYIGIENVIDNQHPSDVRIVEYSIEQGDDVTKYLSDNMADLRIDRLTSAHLSFQGEWTAPRPFTESDYSYNPEIDEYYLTNGNYDDEFTVSFFSAGAHSKLQNIGIDLSNDECVIYTNRSGFDPDTITILGKTFHVTECVYEEKSQEYATNSYDMIFGSRDIVLALLSAYNNTSFRPNDGREIINLYYTDNNKEQQETQCVELLDTYLHNHPEGEFYYSTKIGNRDENISVYGGLFFLGIFLGTLFLMETILIIYYKQITEGYEDQKRFEIMQNVGMSLSEVVKSIKSQILIVFFLPLLTAGMHIAFAFPLINRMLKMLDLDNTRLFVICVLCSFGAFTVLYSLIYSLTARTYYKIVK